MLNIFINFRQHLNGLKNWNRIFFFFFLHLPQNRRKHNQPFKMLSFKPNSHFGPSNLKSTSRKLNVLLIKRSFECSYHETIIRSYYISIHICKKVGNSFFYSFWKVTTHKFSNAAAAKNVFSSAYVIGTTYFDECFLFHVITGRHYFL